MPTDSANAVIVHPARSENAALLSLLCPLSVVRQESSTMTAERAKDAHMNSNIAESTIDQRSSITKAGVHNAAKNQATAKSKLALLSAQTPLQSLVWSCKNTERNAIPYINNQMPKAELEGEYDSVYLQDILPISPPNNVFDSTDMIRDSSTIAAQAF